MSIIVTEVVSQYNVMYLRSTMLTWNELMKILVEIGMTEPGPLIQSVYMQSIFIGKQSKRENN